MTKPIEQDRVIRWIALLVAASFFMENLDGTVIGTALPQMAKSFATDPIDINVGISAYMLTLGIFIPVSGWLSDRFGARTIFCSAVAIFTVASLFCGLSQSLPQFVVFRILQGLGGAMMVPVGRFVVLSNTPKQGLVQAIALLTWPGLVAPVLGPPVGGFIAQYSHWSVIFYLNIPIGMAIFILAFKLFPNIWHEGKKCFDPLGFILTGGGLAALLYAAESVSGHGFSMIVVMCFVLGMMALIISGFHLQKSDHPLMELTAMRYPSFAVSMLGGTLFRMTANAVVFVLPLAQQLGFGRSPSVAGLMLVPIFIGNLVIKPFTTPILRRFGLKNTLLWNSLLNALFLALYAVFQADTPFWMIGGILFISGVFRSIQYTALNVIAFVDVTPKQLNGANALFSTIFQLGIGLGIAFGALSIRMGEAILSIGGESILTPYQIAFLLIAFLSLIPLWGIIRLDPHVGDQVARVAK